MADQNINVRIKHKYDTEANWSSKNPVLLKGEIAFSSDKNGQFKIGDGTNKWSTLNYNSVPWSGVTGKPSTFTPSSHTHDDRYYTESEVESKLSAKSNNGHTHSTATTNASGFMSSTDKIKLDTLASGMDAYFTQ